jgi:hypothetical protein
VSKLSDLLDCACGAAESLEDCADVGAWLHRDNSELILLVDPDQEGLVLVVENASAVGPVTV